MWTIFLLTIHFFVTVTKLLGPGGARAVVAESMMMKQQLIVLNRSRKRGPSIEAMVEAIIERGIDVVIIGVPEPGLLLSSAYFYRRIADKHRVPYEGDVLAYIISHPTLKSDQIHPNAAGNRLLAASVSKLLRDAGTI
ncbi:MAG: hypothetical protein JXA30_06755 [Deltaproteobacteria bacterium]|nr:hypothetical protein [Deltaproteobacteria bacterium]